MEGIQLVVDTRKAANKGAARRLRMSGKIPAILYGEGEPRAVAVDEKEWTTKFRNITSNTIIKLKHGKDVHNVLIKDTQDDILSGQVYHIDFYAIHAGRKIHIQIPIHLEGTPHGVREGGILENKIEELDVVCLPKDLPSHFSVDISHLGVGESLHVGEIPIPEGVEVRTEKNLTVVVVSHVKEEVDSTLEDMEEGIAGAALPDSDAEGAGGEE